VRWLWRWRHAAAARRTPATWRTVQGTMGPRSRPGAGGGGGTLTFDGEQIEITSAVCVLQADTFDVGTVSDNGFRVLVSLNNPQNPISVQILDSDFLQWFQEGNDDQVTRNGSTFTSEERSYFNNSDDRTVNASFTIECP
jgi:hypothetical protein